MMTKKDYANTKKQIKKNAKQHIKLNHTFIKADNTTYGRMLKQLAEHKQLKKHNKQVSKSK